MSIRAQLYVRLLDFVFHYYLFANINWAMSMCVMNILRPLCVSFSLVQHIRPSVNLGNAPYKFPLLLLHYWSKILNRKMQESHAPFY